MSADNGIYVLKTKDQYRVAHLQAIDNVSWSLVDGNWQNKENTKNKLVPTRVVEMWGNSKYTRDERKALSLAHKWANSLPICEYGVNMITYNKTWKHILEDAKNYAEQEIAYINQHPEDRYSLCKLEVLKKIINGEIN